MEPESENVDFKVFLSSEWHNDPPKFEILLDDEVIDTVFYDDETTIKEVKKDLIESDGYSRQIEIIEIPEL